MFKRAIGLTIGLALILGAGLVFSRQPVRLSSAGAMPEISASLDSVPIDLNRSTQEARFYDSQPVLMAIYLDFQDGFSQASIAHYYYLFAGKEHAYFAINPLNAFNPENIDPSGLGLNSTLSPLNLNLLKVWPSTALEIADNNGGAPYGQGKFKTSLFLANPEGGIMAWYMSYNHIERGSFKIVINALSGAVQP
jgi:hypothetical protein